MNKIKFKPTLVITLVGILMLMAWPLSASALPESAQDIRDADPTATDGEYTIYPNGNTQIFSVYCYDMATNPREYLSLPNNGGSYNFGQYTAGGASPGTNVKTNYQKIRIDPATLQVDIGDQTFATSSGSLFHGSTHVTSMPYGVAMDCITPYSQSGIANIDLSDTPFAVADTFTVGGYMAAGSATFSQNNQIVNLNGGGYAGWITPSPWMYNPINAQGGFRLNLEYIGPTKQFVDVDIKPDSDLNTINNDGNGVIPVAILGSQYLDVTEIDAGTVTLEGMPVRAVGKNNKLLAHYEDVNEDTILDLVVQIEDTDGTFAVSDTIATLTGNLLDVTPIEGQDSIRIVPQK